jgi:major intracellular serine protease
MYKLQVIADKLNIRSTPEADPTFANWIGDMNKGEEFSAINIVKGGEYNGSPYWYKDNNNRFASITGIGDNDPAISWSLRVLGVPHIWNITKGEGVKIAVIDSGIDLTNNDLSVAVPAANRFNILDGSTNVQDVYFHGTYCSSIIASRGNNGIIGVAPASELIVIKVANKRKDFKDSNILPGIQKALDLNADIISISYGNIDENSQIDILLKKMIALGKICIAAAGDNSQELHVEFPANTKGMISVGNIFCLNTSAQLNEGVFGISNRSNGGDSTTSSEGITIVAPGEEVNVYDLQGKVQTLVRGFGGTSFSTPYVAGIAALWLSIIKKKSLFNINYHEKFKDFITLNANKNFDGYNSKFWGHGVITPISLLSI